MTSVVRSRMSRASASWIRRSDSVSRALVASSRIRIGAFFRIARAIAMRWRCPPESNAPPSPTLLSQSAGQALAMNSSALAASAAARIYLARSDAACSAP